MSYFKSYEAGRAAALAKFAEKEGDDPMERRKKRLLERRPDLAVKLTVGWKEQAKAPKKLGEG